MRNPLKSIIQFNQNAGLIEAGYDDFREASFQVEEALEGFSNHKFAEIFPELSKEAKPKDISRAIVSTAITGSETLSDVDRLDKACDAVVFAVGSMAKLGLSAQDVTAALNIVMDANMAKLKCPKDEYGKLTKPDNFPDPEPKLQALLDKVKANTRKP